MYKHHLRVLLQRIVYGVTSAAVRV